MADFGRRTNPSVSRSIAELGPATPKHESARDTLGTLVVVDARLPPYTWRDRQRPFAVMCGHKCYGSYATEAEAQARVSELGR
jgi:hypothetical protein